jgi:hypothetical protein
MSEQMYRARKAREFSHGGKRMIRPTVVAVVVWSLVLGLHRLPILIHSFAVVVSIRPTTKSSSYIYPSSFDPFRLQHQAPPQRCKVRHFPRVSTEASVVSMDHTSGITESNLDEKLTDCLQILNRAAETKADDLDAVYQALVDLEQVSRLVGELERQGDGSTAASSAAGNCTVAKTALSSNALVTQLNGSWRLVYTTGADQTQEKESRRINYHPLKVIQSFNTDSKTIADGIYLGNFCILKLSGLFDFDTATRRLEYDFNALRLLDVFTIPLAGATRLAAAASGSESKKLPFFNWISADATLATARRGRGVLVWKRVLDDSR